MNLEGSRILVTGGAGQLGSHVIDRLIAENPEEIIAFDNNPLYFEENRSPKLSYRNVRLFHGDITKVAEVREALNGIDFVVHTASLLTPESRENPRRSLEVNILGTFNLIEGCAASKVKKVVYSSSTAIYGNPLINPMNENHPFNPTTMYGVGKVTCELLLRLFKKTQGLDYIALRYTVLYGPRQHHRANIARYIPECFDRLEHGLPAIIYGDGSQPYDYIYVEDVARANVLALKSSVTEESFNIGTGMTKMVKDVVQIIGEVTQSSLEPIYVPQIDHLVVGGGFGVTSNFSDVTKAQKMLGFKAEVSLGEGLLRYFNWRKTNVLRKG